MRWLMGVCCCDSSDGWLVSCLRHQWRGEALLVVVEEDYLERVGREVLDWWPRFSWLEGNVIVAAIGSRLKGRTLPCVVCVLLHCSLLWSVALSGGSPPVRLIELKYDTFLEGWESFWLNTRKGTESSHRQGVLGDGNCLRGFSWKPVSGDCSLSFWKNWRGIRSYSHHALPGQCRRPRSKLWRLERRKTKAWPCRSYCVAGIGYLQLSCLSLHVLFINVACWISYATRQTF